jgi:transcriptional antiterminator RfaH
MGWKTAPLFAGYFFCRIVDRWWPVEHSLGVASLIRFGGAAPTPVPDAVIAALLERADRDGIVRLPTAAPTTSRLQPGARVKVVAGPFRGVDALYVGQTAAERETILFELLGGARTVEIARGLIAAR